MIPSGFLYGNRTFGGESILPAFKETIAESFFSDGSAHWAVIFVLRRIRTFGGKGFHSYSGKTANNENRGLNYPVA